MKTVNTRFNAAERGFRFVNSFTIPDTLRLTSLRRKSPPVILEDVVYGLCGGMVFAALDYFQRDKPIPTFEAVRDLTPELFQYLWARQRASLKYPVLKDVLAWTLRDDASLASSVAGHQVSKLWARLDAGEPAPLVLIRVGGISQLMQNHQVLATGYDYAAETERLAIRLYDPNYPGKTPTLTLNLASPRDGIKLAESTGDTLRGFFVIGYEPKTPP